MKTKNQQIERFTDFLRQYEGLLFRVVNTYCRNAEAQKDLLQEIRLQLWRAFPGYRPEQAGSSWVYRIALNVSISWVRKKSRRQKMERSLPDHLPGTGDENKPQMLKRLYRLIEQLRPLDKALILLYLEDLPQKEIAEIMGISLANVSTRIGRIKKQLVKLQNS